MTRTARILARATADELRPGLWSVEVEGGPQGEMWMARRVYDIVGTQDVAAREGISRFVDEMENLVGADNEN